MIIYNFHVVRVTFLPFKANPPLIIDPNTVLTQAVAFQFFQTISRRDTQVLQDHSPIEHSQFTQRYLLNIGG